MGDCVVSEHGRTNTNVDKQMSMPVHHLDVDIRIAGHLDLGWETWLAPLRLIHEADGSTRLRGALPDQAALYGMLIKLRDLGASLITVQVSKTGS